MCWPRIPIPDAIFVDVKRLLSFADPVVSSRDVMIVSHAIELAVSLIGIAIGKYRYIAIATSYMY